MPPSKFEANPTLRLRVRHASLSLFPVASSCSNDCFHVYAKIYFLANQLFFPNTVKYICHIVVMDLCLLCCAAFVPESSHRAVLHPSQRGSCCNVPQVPLPGDTRDCRRVR